MTREVTPTVVLAFVAQLVEAHASRAVSAQHLALAELLRVARGCDLAEYVPVEPRAEVRRDLAGSHAYELTTALDGVVLHLFEATHDAAVFMTIEQVRALIADLAGVLAALGARP